MLNSLNSDGFREVAWLIDVGAFQNCGIVGEQLQRNRIQYWCLKIFDVYWHAQYVHAVATFEVDVRVGEHI